MRRRLRGKDVVAVLDELTAIRGAPVHLRADNGPEMISKAVKEGARRAARVRWGS